MMKVGIINLIYFISFSDLFGVGLTFPLFGNYLKGLGASHTLIGLCSSAYAGLQLFSGPLIVSITKTDATMYYPPKENMTRSNKILFKGSWSDVRGRKQVLQITLLCCAICYGLTGITNSILFILLLRIILGTVKHTQSICKAMIADTIPPTKQTEAYGRTAALSSMGFVIGPFLGGHLSDVEGGFAYVSGITVLLFLLNLGLSVFLPDKLSMNRENQNSLISNIKEEFSKSVKELRDIDWKVHWDNFLLRFLFCVALTCYFTNESLYLKEKYELSQKHIGYIISFFSTVGMFTAFFLHRINNFYKNDHTYFTRLLHFSILLTSCFFGIAVSSNLWILISLLVPFSIASTSIRVVSMELMLKKSDKFHKGSFSGASNSVMSLARFVTPFITGIISDIFTERSVMFVGIVPSFLCVLLTLYMKKYVQNKNN